MVYSLPLACTVRSRTAGLQTQIRTGAEASYGNYVLMAALESETPLQQRNKVKISLCTDETFAVFFTSHHPNIKLTFVKVILPKASWAEKLVLLTA